MKRSLFWVFCSCALWPVAWAMASSPVHPYSGIVQSNVFRLRSPPIDRVAEPSPPLPKITLEGITTIFGDKRALFKVTYSRNPAQAGKEQAFIIREGERDGPIEVLEMDETLGRVR